MKTQLRQYQGKSARMSRLVTILRAAHCRSTHHYLAIDSLPLIATVSGQRLAQLLLKHHDEYLVGAKAPDKSFRDFQNHVLHVEQNNWGGAPKACKKWYDETVDLLSAKKWKKAAYACGVLSHYFTDPFMPLHTAQSDRESVVHRPLEWSVCKSYESLYETSKQKHVQPITLSNSDDWICNAVTEGAQRSNQIYTEIIDDYDLKRGCKVPSEGLGRSSRESLSGVIGLTLRSWADVLIRLADDAQVEIPDVSLTMATLLATIDMPLAWIVRKISDVNEQAAVKRIFKEYESTGTVRRHAPAEVKTVAVESAKASVLAANASSEATPRRATALPATALPAAPATKKTANRFTTVDLTKPNAAPAPELPATPPQAGSPSVATLISTPASQPAKTASQQGVHEAPKSLAAPHTPEVSSAPSSKITLSQARAQAARPAGTETTKQTETNVDSRRSVEPIAEGHAPIAKQNQKAAVKDSTTTSRSANTLNRQTTRSTPNVSIGASVTLANDLVDAPSIGPKTAARFAKIGIHTIGEFIAAAPAEMHQQLDTRWITEELINEWQDQAQLVCDVPALCGYKSQLLVAAGCRTSRDLSRCAPAELYQRITHVTRGIDGQRILRSAKPPSSQDVSNWIASALDNVSRRAA